MSSSAQDQQAAAAKAAEELPQDKGKGKATEPEVEEDSSDEEMGDEPEVCFWFYTTDDVMECDDDGRWLMFAGEQINEDG